MKLRDFLQVHFAPAKSSLLCGTPGPRKILPPFPPNAGKFCANAGQAACKAMQLT
jgi:hypothetical protein